MAHWVRCDHDGRPWFGLLQDETIVLHDAAPWDGGKPTGTVLPRDQAALLAPVVPRSFIGLWNNFHAAAAKQGNAIPAEPLFFLKATTSILAPGGEIRPPAHYAGRTLYEGELGVVIGRTCRNLDLAAADAAIFGYTCVNDVTALDWLTADPAFPQWARAKGCDSFGPVGPAIATDLDWRGVTVRTLLGGRERQNYPASDMILSPPEIVRLLSREMTLQPGDLIACGTSLGALPMRPGAVVEVAIDGIGVLRNTLASAPA
jgi:2-keto-4-pentenoate hydratase/2-oxohepta-3-ene-1,7-dioic acid hydratase in catechol pathway